MGKKVCDKCNYEISKSNFKKHIKVCNGEGPYNQKPRKKKIYHSLIPDNLDEIQKYYNNNHTIFETAKKFNISPGKLCRLSQKKIFKTRTNNESLDIRGTRAGCFFMSKSERSDHAYKYNFGGYREGSGKSKKYYIEDSFGKRTCLQSSYELECAQILNKLGARWYRPSFLQYQDRKYFPDFYLPDYNIYLDPKNDYLIKKDKKKIEKVLNENNINLYILSKEQLTEEYICSILNI